MDTHPNNSPQPKPGSPDSKELEDSLERERAALVKEAQEALENLRRYKKTLKK